MKHIKTHGLILIDVDVVALNNAGANTASNFDNAVATKRIHKNGRSYVYVSGQAWRYWWRDALQKNLGWQLSPVIREKKIAYSSADPFKYPDDDVFGYMRAARAVVLDEQGNPKKDNKGKEKTENVTVTRVSPLKNSAIVSAASVQPVENWSSMARQEGDSVPYAKQEYSAIMKGMFSMDAAQVGTFSNYNKTGYVNITDAMKVEALNNGASEIEDDYLKDEKGQPLKLVRIDDETRKQRAVDTILALKNIDGGAMQTTNLGDVTPKFIILASTSTGNHPFSHVASNYGNRDEFADINMDALREIINDYRDDFEGKLYIGKRTGFMDEKNDELQELQDEYKDFIELTTVNKAIDQYSEQLKNQMD